MEKSSNLHSRCAQSPFLALMDHSVMILMDPSGIQEAVGTLRKHILILRRHAERMEAVNADYAWLVGAEPAAILERADWVMTRMKQGAHCLREAQSVWRWQIQPAHRGCPAGVLNAESNNKLEARGPLGQTARNLANNRLKTILHSPC